MNIYIIKILGVDGQIQNMAMREGAFVTLAAGQRLVSVSEANGLQADGPATADTSKSVGIKGSVVTHANGDTSHTFQDSGVTQTLTVHSGQTVSAVKVFVPQFMDSHGAVVGQNQSLSVRAYGESSATTHHAPVDGGVDTAEGPVFTISVASPGSTSIETASYGNSGSVLTGGPASSAAATNIAHSASITFTPGTTLFAHAVTDPFNNFDNNARTFVTERESSRDSASVSHASYQDAYINQIIINSAPVAETVAPNQAPVHSVPSAQSVNEDATLTFNDANTNKITISDANIGSSNATVILTATNGVVSLSQTTGLNFIRGDGNADNIMEFTGKLTDINASLNGLTFRGDSHYYGAASLRIQTDDQQGATDDDTIAITVNSVNDVPINTIPDAQSMNEDATLTFNEANGNKIYIADADVGSDPVEITLTATSGTLTLSQVTGLTFATGDGTADASMVFTGTVSAINAALNGLIFSSDANFEGAASLRIQTEDPQGSSDDDTITITVNAVNDTPVNAVPGAQSVDENATLVFNTANGNKISVTDIDASSDPIQVTLTATNGTVTLSQVTGLSFTAGDGTNDATMTFTGAIAAINAALDGLSFTGDNGFNGDANLQMVTNDQANNGSGGALSDTDNIAITVDAAVNSPPVNTVPGVQSVDEGSALTFNEANGNKISIADANIGGGDAKVTLTATNGTLTLSQMTGLTFTTGDGTSDASMVFTGTVAAINAALDGLTLTPTANFFGQATLQITSDDQNGGGALTDTDTINVAITPVAINASTDLDGTNGYTIAHPITLSRGAAEAVGDVNNDGYIDYLITGGRSDVYVRLGRAGDYTATIATDDLTDGIEGFNITFDTSGSSNGFGQSVAGIGDINGDGYDDMLIGEYRNDINGANAGAAYVVFGKADWTGTSLRIEDLNGSNGFTFFGINADEEASFSIHSAGDVNKDGYNDFLIGAARSDPGGNSNAGETYLIYGKSGAWDATFELSSLAAGDGSAGTVFRAASAGDFAGASVSGGGDINGDGYDDFIIGAEFGDSLTQDSGETYIVFGKSGGFGATFDLSTLDGTNGFIIASTEFPNGTRSGFRVSNLGDINGDGYDDIITTSINHERADVIFGKADWSSTAVFDIVNLNGSNGFSITGDSMDLGYAVGTAGDFNGDGYNDFVITNHDTLNTNAETAYLIYGKADGWDADFDVSTMTSADGFQITNLELWFANDTIVSAGDTNGDGYDDLIIAEGPDNSVIFGFDTRGETTHAGTTGNDTLTGDAGANILVGGQGDDILNGAGGDDVLIGGSGDDILVFDQLDTLKVAGGSGHDTLRFDGTGQSLDLTSITNNLYTGMERIDLTGVGNNSVTFSVHDVLDLSDSTNVLYIDGNAGDSVTSTGEGWADNGTTTVEGTVYHSYSMGDAQLYVDDTITQTIT